MLDCRNNYVGKYGSKICDECKCIDDERHAANYCVKWKNVNRHGDIEKILFDNVFTDDKLTLDSIATELLNIWDIANDRNSIRCN